MSASVMRNRLLAPLVTLRSRSYRPGRDNPQRQRTALMHNDHGRRPWLALAGGGEGAGNGLVSGCVGQLMLPAVKETGPNEGGSHPRSVGRDLGKLTAVRPSRSRRQDQGTPQIHRWLESPARPTDNPSTTNAPPCSLPPRLRPYCCVGRACWRAHRLAASRSTCR